MPKLALLGSLQGGPKLLVVGTAEETDQAVDVVVSGTGRGWLPVGAVIEPTISKARRSASGALVLRIVPAVERERPVSMRIAKLLRPRVARERDTAATPALWLASELEMLNLFAELDEVNHAIEAAREGDYEALRELGVTSLTISLASPEAQPRPGAILLAIEPAVEHSQPVPMRLAKVLSLEPAVPLVRVRRGSDA
jgi:hypothetical protein